MKGSVSKPSEQVVLLFCVEPMGIWPLPRGRAQFFLGRVGAKRTQGNKSRLCLSSLQRMAVLAGELRNIHILVGVWQSLGRDVIRAQFKGSRVSTCWNPYFCCGLGVTDLWIYVANATLRRNNVSTFHIATAA